MRHFIMLLLSCFLLAGAAHGQDVVNIAGVVTDAETGLPLVGARVTMWRATSTATSELLDETVSASDGSYSVSGGGSNNLRVSAEMLEYFTKTSFLSAASGSFTRNLALTPDRTGTLEVEVVDVDSGAPVPQVTITTFSGSKTTNEEGRAVFQIAAGLTAVCAEDRVGRFVGRCHDGLQHPPATLESATPIEVVRGQLSMVQLALERGHAFVGIARDELTGLPLVGVPIQLWFESENYQYAEVITEGDGRFTVRSIVPGDYLLMSYPKVTDRSFLPQLFPGLHCMSTCPWEQGAPVTVQAEEQPPIDIAFRSAAGLSGVVTDAATGEPLEGIDVRAGKNLLGWADFGPSATTDALGRYRIDYLQADSSLLLRTRNAAGRVNKAWIDRSCHESDCLSGSTSFRLDWDELRDGFDFALDGGVSISGWIGSADRERPTVAAVSLVRPTGTIAWRFRPREGEYSTAALPPGSYYAVAKFTHDGVRTVAWPGVECPTPFSSVSCPNAVLIDVSSQPVTGIDFIVEQTPRFRSGFEP